MTSQHLEAGFRAMTAGAWGAAEEAFSTVLEEGMSAEALDGLGRALWWLKRPVEGIEARTRAYTEYRRSSRNEEAARIATWIAREQWSLFGDRAAADGWVARAESLVPQDGSSVAGWVLVARAESAAEPATSIELCTRALAVGRDMRDSDLEILALARLGVLEIASGAVESGVRRLDEAMAAASAGEGADPQTLAEAYCALMEAGDLLGDTERVASWSGALTRFQPAPDLGPLALHGSTPLHGALSSFCGSCCGGIYMVTGRLDEAEDELLAAIAKLEDAGMRSRCVHPITQLAELRVAQGRLEEARFLLTAFADLPESARPLAMVELALGNALEGSLLLRRRLAQLEATPVAAFATCLLLVDAELARNDLEAAEGAVSEVERIASVTGSVRHGAQARLSRGKLEARRGSAVGAQHLREAAGELAEAGLPYLACRARLELARALVPFDPPTAITEARSALAAFERLGAASDADAAAALLRELGAKGRTGPRDVGLLTNRELDVLRLVGQGLSNAEIAARLYISVKTAGHHVSSILSKLGLRSRTEVAAFAAIHPIPERAVK